MKYIILLTILLNIILIPAFLTSMFLTLHRTNNVKAMANSAVFSFSFKLAYMFCLIVTAILGAIKYNLGYLTLLIFVLIPFIIGYFVTFKTIRVYSYLQVFSYFLSLGILFIL